MSQQACTDWRVTNTDNGQAVQRAGQYAETQDELLFPLSSSPQVTTCELLVDPLNNLSFRKFPKPDHQLLHAHL